ncbi:MAG: GNAT family N-acetyltransferase [Burkholderiaceae bacterium]
MASCFLSLTLADMPAAQREAVTRSQNEHSIAVCLRPSGKLIGDLFAEPEDDTFSVGWNFNPGFGARAMPTKPQRRSLPICSRRAGRAGSVPMSRTRTWPHSCASVGMRREGLFMEFVTFKNDAQGAPIYENTMQYALLRHEWLSQKRPCPLRPRSEFSAIRTAPPRMAMALAFNTVFIQ